MRSFVNETQRAVPNEKPDAPRAVGAGVRGGSRGVDLVTPVAKKPAGFDMNQLLQFGQDLIAPVIKQQQEAAFLDGMSRASDGEAAADIAAKRPEWAQAFGDDAATQGARAFEKVADSAALQTEMAATLEDTRAISSEDFTTEFHKRVNKLKTGDPVRDAVLMQSAVAFFPDAKRMHTRAHKAWQQEQAEAAHQHASNEVVRSVVGVMDAMRRDPRTIDIPAYENAKYGLTSLFEPLPGVDYERQTLRVVDAIRSSMIGGQFGAMQMLKETGLLSKIPDKHLDNLLATERQAAAQHLEKLVTERIPGAANDWYDTVINFDGPPDKVRARAAEINRQVEQATGVPASVAPFVTERELAQVVIGNAREAKQRAAEEERERQREAKAAARESRREGLKASQEAIETAAAEAKVAAIFAESKGTGAVGERIQALNRYNPGLFLAAEAYFDRAYAGAKPGPERAALLNDWTGTVGPVNSYLQATLHSSLLSPKVDARVAGDLATITALIGTAAGGRYLTGDTGKIAQAAVEELQTNPQADPKTVLEVARTRVHMANLSTARLPKEVSEVTGLWKKQGGGEVGNVGAVLARIQPELSGIPSKDGRAAHFSGAAKRVGLRSLGGVDFLQIDANQPDWESTAMGGKPLSREQAGRAMRAVVDRTIKASKAEPGDVHIVRLPADDPVLGARFMLTSPNGVPRYFSQKDLMDEKAKQDKEDLLRTQKRRLLTPSLPFLN